MTLRISCSTAASCSLSARRCAFIHVRLGCAISPVRFGGHYLDRLMMAGEQRGEFAGSGVGQWSRLRPHHLGKVRQHFRVDPVNLRLPEQNRLPVLEPVSRGTLPRSRRSTRSAFTSPSVRLKGTMSDDWLRAGKRAMCVSVRKERRANEARGISGPGGKTRTGFEGSGNARRRRAEGSLAQPVRNGAAPQNSPLLLIPAIAYRMQENALGALKPSARRHLMRVARNAADGRKAQSYPSLSPKPGTVLARDWGGITHQVKVLEDGLLFRGKRYKSLSEVARVITGSRWSGPQFFGLKSAVKEQSHLGTR